jgi:hypothetical protein
MEGKFGHILPGIGGRSLEMGKQRSIESFTAGRIDQGDKSVSSRGGKHPSQRGC